MTSQSKPELNWVHTIDGAGISVRLSDKSVDVLERRLEQIRVRAQKEIEGVIAELAEQDNADAQTECKRLSIVLRVQQDSAAVPEDTADKEDVPAVASTSRVAAGGDD